LPRPSGDQNGTAGGKEAGGETVPDSFTTSDNQDTAERISKPVAMTTSVHLKSRHLGFMR
jgi:hypothetical protein